MTTLAIETVGSKTFMSNCKIGSGTLLSASGNTITFPDTTATLATTADIPTVVSYQLWDFSSLLNTDFTNCWLFGQHYPDKQVLILFGQVETNYSAQTKTLLDAGVLYSDGASSSRFFIHTTPAVYITLPNSSSSALTIHNDDQLEGSFTFFAVARGSTYTIDSTVATQLI